MRDNRLKRCVLLALIFPGMTDARPVETQFIPVTYECERNVELPMIFINDTQGRSNVIGTIDGKLLKLSQVVSASGARYRDKDEAADSYEIWNRGDKARITYGTLEDSVVLFEDCTEASKVNDPQ